MARYIDANDFMKTLIQFTPDKTVKIGAVILALRAIPTADVVERKKGKWICYPKASRSVKSTAVHIFPVCSECGREYPVTNYCPNCGADMRGET